MTDGIGLLIGAKVQIEDDGDAATIDTIPMTDPLDLFNQNKERHTLYYLQTSYREEMDLDPTGTVEWGFYPVFGYFDETGEYPALSNISSSLPSVKSPVFTNFLSFIHKSSQLENFVGNL